MVQKKKATPKPKSPVNRKRKSPKRRTQKAPEAALQASIISLACHYDQAANAMVCTRKQETTVCTEKRGKVTCKTFDA